MSTSSLRQGLTNSIEKLASSSPSSWQSIPINSAVLSPRSFLTVAALNESEIVIMGGLGDLNWAYGDVIVLNILSNQLRETQTTDSIRFLAYSNQCYQV